VTPAFLLFVWAECRLMDKTAGKNHLYGAFNAHVYFVDAASATCP